MLETPSSSPALQKFPKILATTVSVTVSVILASTSTQLQAYGGAGNTVVAACSTPAGKRICTATPIAAGLAGAAAVGAEAYKNSNDPNVGYRPSTEGPPLFPGTRAQINTAIQSVNQAGQTVNDWIDSAGNIVDEAGNTLSSTASYVPAANSTLKGGVHNQNYNQRKNRYNRHGVESSAGPITYVNTVIKKNGNGGGLYFSKIDKWLSDQAFGLCNNESVGKEYRLTMQKPKNENNKRVIGCKSIGGTPPQQAVGNTVNHGNKTWNDCRKELNKWDTTNDGDNLLVKKCVTGN